MYVSLGKLKLEHGRVRSTVKLQAMSYGL